MRIETFGPNDDAVVAEAAELTNAAQKVDAPFEHPVTVEGYRGWIRHGWDGEPPEMFAGWEADRLVGLLAVEAGEWDNTHLAWLHLVVHPDLRRQGRGSQLLTRGIDRARELGRTSIGTDGWDCEPVVRFAAGHGLPRRGSAIRRRQHVDRVDRTALDAMHAEAAAAAADYELVRIAGRTPEALLPAVAEMTAAINDAPTDDLDIEDEVFPVERVRSYEAAVEGRGQRLYRLLARHNGTGALAGHTVVAVEQERPEIAEQHDTSVVADHRGHRLGLLLKTEMLRWLAETEPALRTIGTWNMESNAPMIGVNERLGYEVLGRELQFQRDIEG
jgi:GNAT superfamily N-acetyltransferase